MTNKDTPSSLREVAQKKKKDTKKRLNELDRSLEEKLENIKGNPDMREGLQLLHEEIKEIRESEGI